MTALPLALAAPADDPVYRAVLAARDEARLKAVVARAWQGAVAAEQMSARVALTHYRPRDRARLLVHVEWPRPGKNRPGQQDLYLQIYPTLAAARRRAGQVAKHALRCVGPPVFLIEEWAAVAWALPNGPMLRTSKMLMGRAKFGRFLVEAGLPVPEGRGPRPPRLVRYVPRHRAVFRHPDPGVGPTYFKLYAPGLDRVAAANLALAREAAAAGAFRVPELLAHVARRRALVMREIPGRSLTDLALGPEGESAFRAVGRALASLHGSAIRPEQRWTFAGEVAALRTAMDDVARALPATRSAIDGLVDDLERESRAASFEEAPVHGNLFADQVIVADDGSVGVVDWDDAAVGDPLYDVGRLVAHVLFLQQRAPGVAVGGPPVRALLAAYRGAGGVIEPRRLAWHVATALLLRAKISALRPLPDGWISDIACSLETARSVIAGSVLQEGSP